MTPIPGLQEMIAAGLVWQHPTTRAMLSAPGAEVANQGHHNLGKLVTDWRTDGVLAGTTLPAGASFEFAPDMICDGLPMLKVTLGTGTGALFVDFTFTGTITLAQLVSLQIPVRFSSNNNAFQGANVAAVYFWDDTSGAVRQWRLATGLNGSRLRNQQTHTLSFGPGVAADGWSFSGSSAPTNSADMDGFTIKRVRIALTVPASAAGEWMAFGPIRANGRRTPVLSVVLDGQYASQHDYILPMLEAQGIRASLAITGSQIGQAGRMSAAQLDRAYFESGHEIILRNNNDAGFGGGYQDAAAFPTAESIANDILDGWSLMRSRGWVRGLGFMVHDGTVMPWTGSVTPARQQVVAQGFAMAGVKAMLAGNANAAGPLNRCQSMARPRNVDPWSLQGAIQWTNTHGSADLIAVATRAKARGEWGLVAGKTSHITAPPANGVLNSDLFAAAQSWGADLRSGGLIALPLGEACNYYNMFG